MNRNILEEFYEDPDRQRRLLQNAHRERARVVKAGLLWLWKQARNLPPRGHGRPARWMARLG